LRYQFGSFEVDSIAGHLLKNGVPVILREQPFQALVTLLSSPGELISRETLRSRLWGDSTYVDFENGLNSAISRLHDALDDVAKAPVWIETRSQARLSLYRSVAKISGGDSLLEGPPCLFSP
jgi:cholera toxin transcriptional activator